jgi:ribosomal-protein-alanine N-acetyltransferase
MSEINIPEFSIRPASEDDLSKVVELEKQSYPLPWTEAAFKGEMTKEYSRFLVLTDDETDSILAAYIVYWLTADECHVLNVTVHREWRGLGLGARMVRQAIQEALRSKAARVFLEVRKSNHAAVGLYQKLGFYIDHIKPRFYENGEDGYFMVLNLDKSNAV